MIVEPRPPVPGRTETSGTEALGPSPDTGDDTFDRTLSSALRADRRDRPQDRRRPETGSQDDRGPGATSRRTDRPGTDDDRVDRRTGDDDPAATNQNPTDDKPASTDPAEKRSAAEGDGRAEVDRGEDQGVDAETPDDRGLEQLEESPAGAVAGATSRLTDPGVDTAGDDGMTRQVAAAGTNEAEDAPDVAPAAALRSLDSAPTPIDDTVEGLRAPTGDDPAGLQVAGPTVTATDGGDATGDPPAAGTGSARGPAAGVETGVEHRESSENVVGGEGADTAVALQNAGTAASTAATDSVPTEPTDSAATASTVDRRPPSIPDRETGDIEATPDSSIPASDATGVAPVDHRATAGEPESGAGAPTPEPESSAVPTELVDPPEVRPSTGGNETVDPSTGAPKDRPASGLTPVSSSRAPLTAPNQAPATAAADSSTTASDLVELQTAGLAERLRPAFAAVRRGVNGLDELRLRIQDDNAGPIKVDIATVDNRIRVLLSAGSDDLIRQLGQDRDRLADELRRAGFDRASIDIESGNRGERHNRFDRGASSRPRSEAFGSGLHGADATSPIGHTSARRQRGLTGLDLDL